MTKTNKKMESISIEKIKEAVKFLEQKGIRYPTIGIVLGTGLHQIIELLENPIIIPYSDIPQFLCPQSNFIRAIFILEHLQKKSAIDAGQVSFL